MVVAGTGISKDVVDQAMASAIMKDSRYRCVLILELSIFSMSKHKIPSPKPSANRNGGAIT